MPRFETPPSCDCGLPAPYEACCGRFHGGEIAPSAELLMRSRYAAYVRELQPYLLATWHATTRPESVQFEAGTRWLGLTVKRASNPTPDTAEVEFVARFRVGGASAVRLQECSRFVRENGRWYYVDGTHD